MPITYEIDATRDLLVLRGSGTVTERDAINVIDQAVTDTNGAAMRKDVLFLLDPGASLNQIDMPAIQRIKKCIENWLSQYPRAPIKCAIVSGPPEDTVAELWRAVTDLHPETAERTRTFRTTSSAYAWLRPQA